MADFEQRARNYETAVSTAAHRVENFGYTHEPEVEVVSRVFGSFVIWLTAVEEARLQEHFKVDSRAYRKYIIDALPDEDNPSWEWSSYEGQTGTLKQRASALWGLRTVFAHGDGDLRLLQSKPNKRFALSAVRCIAGVRRNRSRIELSSQIFHPAIKTVLQLQEIIPRQLK